VRGWPTSTAGRVAIAVWPDVILTAHAGWEGERTRGASALEDWADSIITLVRDKDDEQVRYLRAEGRDVLVDEDRLDFDATARTLTLAGAGSRKQASKTRNVDELVPAVVSAVTVVPGITGYKLKQTLRAGGVSFHNGDELAAAKLAVGRGLLEVRSGPRNSSMYHPIPQTSPTYPDLSQPIPGAGQTTSIGERWNGDRSSTHPTGDRSALDPTMDDAVDVATRLLGARPLGVA